MLSGPLYVFGSQNWTVCMEQNVYVKTLQVFNGFHQKVLYQRSRFARKLLCLYGLFYQLINMLKYRFPDIWCEVFARALVITVTWKGKTSGSSHSTTNWEQNSNFLLWLRRNTVILVVNYCYVRLLTEMGKKIII